MEGTENRRRSAARSKGDPGPLQAQGFDSGERENSHQSKEPPRTFRWNQGKSGKEGKESGLGWQLL